MSPGNRIWINLQPPSSSIIMVTVPGSITIRPPKKVISTSRRRYHLFPNTVLCIRLHKARSCHKQHRVKSWITPHQPEITVPDLHQYSPALGSEAHPSMKATSARADRSISVRNHNDPSTMHLSWPSKLRTNHSEKIGRNHHFYPNHSQRSTSNHW